MPLISVLMPIYDHDTFIPRAIRSLLAQTCDDWELIIMDDGSPGDTFGVIRPFTHDDRIHYHTMGENTGLGAALNAALDIARGKFIAYLPADDVVYPEHLKRLHRALSENPGAMLAYSGVRHHYKRFAKGQIPGYSLQLVQVMHRYTADRWLTRRELVTDDLGRMYWNKLAARGRLIATEEVTCEWVDHPGQLHKLLREPEGGLNRYRAHFNIQHPLRFHSSIGNFTDEVEQYGRFRERPPTPPATDALKIVLVGELAYNAERVLALEERGHKLYGLWMPDPQWHNTVGPLPFGHVTEISRTHWQDELRRIQPDAIYALLNYHAVPFAHEVMTHNPGIPFVWHFKEGPFHCLEKGTWQQLLELHTQSDGQIYSSPEMRDWFNTFLNGSDDSRTLILDGDLPKRDWFVGERSPLLSEKTGEIHTVVPGRPIGLHPYVMKALDEQGVHVHFYGDYTQGQWRDWLKKVEFLGANNLHLHPNVDQRDWLREFSQYDAGWLHFFYSRNGGEISRALWDDLNYPARIATLAVSGLPMIMYSNPGHIVAAENLLNEWGMGVLFRTIEELGDQLRDRAAMAHTRERVWSVREHFTFDAHADRLIAFFRQVIAAKHHV